MSRDKVACVTRWPRRYSARRSSSWLETSRGLLARVGAHALDLTNDGIEYAALERDNAENLRAVGSP